MEPLLRTQEVCNDMYDTEILAMICKQGVFNVSFFFYFSNQKAIIIILKQVRYSYLIITMTSKDESEFNIKFKQKQWSLVKKYCIWDIDTLPFRKRLSSASCLSKYLQQLSLAKENAESKQISLIKKRDILFC